LEIAIKRENYLAKKRDEERLKGM